VKERFSNILDLIILHYFFKSAKNRGKGGVQTDTTFETSQEHFKSSEREVFIILIRYVMGRFDS
jgi:hypothetical protein